MKKFFNPAEGISLPTDAHRTLLEAVLNEYGKGFNTICVRLLETDPLPASAKSEWKWREQKWVQYEKAAKMHMKSIQAQLKMMSKALNELKEDEEPDAAALEYLKSAFDFKAFEKTLGQTTKVLLNEQNNFKPYFEVGVTTKVNEKFYFERTGEVWKMKKSGQRNPLDSYLSIDLPVGPINSIAAVHINQHPTPLMSRTEWVYWKMKGIQWEPILYSQFRKG
jgi:hypothetical protein